MRIVVLLTTVLTLNLVPAPGAPAATGGAPGVGSQARSGQTVEATPEAAALIDRVQDALGGRKRLAGVRSLLIDARSITSAEKEESSSYRILLPDRYQAVRAGLTFTIDAGAFWQLPEQTETIAAAARKNITSSFAELSIKLLLRAPAQLPVKAALVSCETPGRQCLLFTGEGGFNLTVEIDAKTSLPTAYSRTTQATRGGSSATMPMTRQVTLNEFRTVDGIRFPVRMTDTWGNGYKITTEYRTIQVNEGVAPADFKRR